MPAVPWCPSAGTVVAAAGVSGAAAVSAGPVAPDAAAVLLETHALEKSFAGFVAVAGVSLTVLRGTIHALIGPNGAGKTTLFNLLTGFVAPTAGRIVFRGQDITGIGAAAVARRGMVRSFQISSVFPHLSVLENVRIALQRPGGLSWHFWRSERCLTRLDGRALELLAAVDLQAQPHALAGALPYGRKRALELAVTLATDPELLLLDEPTQGMGHEDVGRVTELIRRAADGRTVLLVEHNMQVVASIAATITVLQRGAVLAEGPYATVAADPRVIAAYMGPSAVGSAAADPPAAVAGTGSDGSGPVADSAQGWR